MSDKIEGFLEVGRNEQGEVVINHPDLKPDENGVGHIVFSVNQARNLARLLEKQASEAEAEIEQKREQERIAAIPPADRTKRCMLSGNPETDDHRELRADGMQKDYVVLWSRSSSVLGKVDLASLSKALKLDAKAIRAKAEKAKADELKKPETPVAQTSAKKATKKAKAAKR